MSKSADLAAEINRGVMSQRAGDVVAAINTYHRILHRAPNHAEANHLLGVCYLQTKDFERAEALISKAIKFSPRMPDFHSNYGLVLAALGRVNEAISSFERAIRLDKTHGDALLNLGHLLQQLGQMDRALEHYRKATVVRPSCRAFSNVGALLSQQGKHLEAVQNLQQAVELDPSDRPARVNLGNAYRLSGKLEAAIEQYDRALLIDPTSVDALNGRACVLVDLKRVDEAIEDLLFALKLKPLDALVNRNLGNCYVTKQLFDLALVYLGVAVNGNALDDQAFFSRGAILLEKGHRLEAIADFDRVLEINPRHARASWNKSIASLQLGDFKTGWELYETRWVALPEQLSPLKTSKPRWSDGDRSGRLLVWSEQGAGDEVFFSRTLANLELLSDLPLVQIDGRFIPLFERSFPDLRFIARRRKVAEADYDVHIPMGSLLPIVYGNAGELLSERQRVPYLRSGMLAQSVQETLNRVRRSGDLIVGLTWQSKNLVHGSSKSFSLDDLNPIFDLKGLTFVSLQYGDVGAELESFCKKRGVSIIQFSEIDNFHDIDDHVSLIDACDFVVSGCNTTAHLVGAIGKRAFVGVTHGQAAFWYWHNTVGERSLWYPSISLVQHRAGVQWSETVKVLCDRVSEHLREVGDARPA